jgi:hypothetical protein
MKSITLAQLLSVLQGFRDKQPAKRGDSWLQFYGDGSGHVVVTAPGDGCTRLEFRGEEQLLSILKG